MNPGQSFHRLEFNDKNMGSGLEDVKYENVADNALGVKVNSILEAR